MTDTKRGKMRAGATSDDWFGLASHWLRKWREFRKPITEQIKGKLEITFDIQLKTALKILSTWNNILNLGGWNFLNDYCTVRLYNPRDNILRVTGISGAVIH